MARRVDIEYIKDFYLKHKDNMSQNKMAKELGVCNRIILLAKVELGFKKKKSGFCNKKDIEGSYELKRRVALYNDCKNVSQAIGRFGKHAFKRMCREF